MTLIYPDSRPGDLESIRQCEVRDWAVEEIQSMIGSFAIHKKWRSSGMYLFCVPEVGDANLVASVMLDRGMTVNGVVAVLGPEDGMPGIDTR